MVVHVREQGPHPSKRPLKIYVSSIPHPTYSSQVQDVNTSTFIFINIGDRFLVDLQTASRIQPSSTKSSQLQQNGNPGPGRSPGLTFKPVKTGIVGPTFVKSHDQLS